MFAGWLWSFSLQTYKADCTDTPHNFLTALQPHLFCCTRCVAQYGPSSATYDVGNRAGGQFDRLGQAVKRLLDALVGVVSWGGGRKFGSHVCKFESGAWSPDGGGKAGGGVGCC
jgi:hypothetical protein